VLVTAPPSGRHLFVPSVKTDPAALPFVAIAAVPSAVAAWLGSTPVTLILLLLPVSVALFFRDPERQSPGDADLVLSPADGRVMFAGRARPEDAPPGAWNQVTIFLSVLDVHINRTPVAGRIQRVDYHPGTFLPAYRHDSSKNEHSEIWIDHGGIDVVTRQVVGLLARRVVCRVRPGETVGPGARIGLMKFGSRMDVFTPDDSEITVKTGERVRAGVTVIGRLRRVPS
jgi:phosphatidylserine decarboxylase